MSKSKSLYKQDFPSFSRKGSLDIKSLHGLNPQIFTIQAQSFINQNFFQSNANTTDFLHEKSNHFISNLRKLSQKKLKSERTSSDLKKISNKSATAFNQVAPGSLLDSFPKKLNLRLNSSAAAQTRGIKKSDTHSQIKNESIVSNDSIDGKKLEELLEKCIASALGGEDPCQLMDETLRKSPKKESRFLDFWRKPLERSLQVLWRKSVENNEIKEDFKAIVKRNELEIEEKSRKIEELQKIVGTQSQQIEILQTKEKQLIQFLLAIKARGIVDLEAIFNEEFNNNEEKSSSKKKNQDKNHDKSKNCNLRELSFNEISQEADISRVNDSEESSFNYFGKSDGSSIQINSFLGKKVEEIAKNEKKTGKVSGFRLNLKELQSNCDGCEEKEEVLPSETQNNNKNDKPNKNLCNNNNFEHSKPNKEIVETNEFPLNFKKQKDERKLSPNINEEMKENLLEKLKNFRKVYEKLSKK